MYTLHCTISTCLTLQQKKVRGWSLHSTSYTAECKVLHGKYPLATLLHVASYAHTFLHQSCTSHIGQGKVVPPRAEITRGGTSAFKHALAAHPRQQHRAGSCPPEAPVRHRHRWKCETPAGEADSNNYQTWQLPVYCHSIPQKKKPPFLSSQTPFSV